MGEIVVGPYEMDSSKTKKNIMVGTMNKNA